MSRPTEWNGTADGLTRFQVRVARLFFSLPTSEGFLLAGGAALVAQRLTNRPTRDLDFFTRHGAGDVPAATTAFEIAAHDQGWKTQRVRDTPTFCRIVVTGPSDVLVDVALDTPPSLPTIASVAGPTFGLEELAGRKVIALFDRAEARDFTDVYVLAQRYGKALLLKRASEIDNGFTTSVFAEMLDTLGRFHDTDLPARTEQISGIRKFFRVWAEELRC